MFNCHEVNPRDILFGVLMATKLRFFKVSSLPAAQDLIADAIYFVSSADAGLMEVHVANSAGSGTRHVINKTEILALINSAVSTIGTLVIVADIAARDVLSYTQPRFVYVENATGDNTVASGGATYLYNPDKPAGQKWVKTSEAESLDVAISWSALTGKPTSTPAQIDSAVTNSHTHANKSVLDSLTVDAGGDLLISGELTHTGWDEAVW